MDFNYDRSKAYVISSVRRRVIIILFLAALLLVALASTVIYTTFFYLTGNFEGAALCLAGLWLVVNLVVWLVRGLTGSWQPGLWMPLLSGILAAVALGAGWFVYTAVDDYRHLALDIWAPVKPVSLRMYRHAAHDRAVCGLVVRQMSKGDFSTEEKIDIYREVLRSDGAYSDTLKDVYDQLIPMGPAASPLVPELGKIIRRGGLEPLAGESRLVSPLDVLIAIGPTAKDAVPDLIATLPRVTSHNHDLSAERALKILDALGKIDPQAPKAVVPVLVDEFHKVRQGHGEKYAILMRKMAEIDLEKTRQIVPDLERWLSESYLILYPVSYVEVLILLDPGTARKVVANLNTRRAEGKLDWDGPKLDRLAQLSTELGVAVPVKKKP